MKYPLSIVLLVAAMALGAALYLDNGTRVSWAALGVEGLKLELVSETAVEDFRFSKDGSVTATLGIKNGPVTGPILYWRIVGEDLIISQEPGAEALIELPAPTIKDNILSIRRWLVFKTNYRMGRRGV
nr:hypothetical protein [uncultured Rhodoferax sp.]